MLKGRLVLLGQLALLVQVLLAPLVRPVPMALQGQLVRLAYRVHQALSE